MPLSVLLSALPIFAAAAIVAAGIMALTIRLTTAGHGARSLTTPAHPPTREAVFLFAEETLVDASPGAHDLLATLPGGGTERERLARFLDRRYPAFADRHDPAGDPVTLSPIDGTDMPLTIRAMGSQVRISLGNAEVDRVDPPVIRLTRSTLLRHVRPFQSSASILMAMQQTNRLPSSLAWHARLRMWICLRR